MSRYNTVISAVGREGQWKKALKLLEEMDSKMVSPDVITYNSCISGKLDQQFRPDVVKRKSQKIWAQNLWMSR